MAGRVHREDDNEAMGNGHLVITSVMVLKLCTHISQTKTLPTNFTNLCCGDTLLHNKYSTQHVYEHIRKHLLPNQLYIVLMSPFPS